jgi:glycosyltransferase involved in cell wall biosynthesis
MNLHGLRKLASKFDIVHGQDTSSFPLIYFSKRIDPELPWVVTAHDGFISELQFAIRSLGRGGAIGDFLRYVVGFPAWDAILRGDLRYADVIVPVSDNLSNEIMGFYRIDPRRIVTIPIGVDIEHLESLARFSSPPVASNKVKLFWAGRMSWRKGIIHLMHSLSHLIHEIGFNDFELQMFGRGPLESKVRVLVAALNLNSNVRLRGFVKYEELIASMATSDIVCFPSLYEACPVGLVEAMVLGRPTVAFDRPYSRELIGMEGVLARGISDYAEVLHDLCTDSGLRQKLGKRLKVRAQGNFDIRLIAGNYLKLYQETLASK